MATLDKTGDGVQWKAGDRAYVTMNTISLVDAADADVVQALYIPANTYVRNVFMRIDTATGLTSTANIGDDAGANSWDAAVNLNATANTVTFGIAGTDAYVVNNGGKLYTAANTIDLTLSITSGPCTAGQVTVWADCVDLN